jgi:hypothetical protein
MPQPIGTIVAGPLRQVSVGYKNPNYVADGVAPVIDNVPPEAKIAKYLKGAWFRDEAEVRGPGARAARGGYPTDWIDVVLKEYAFAKEVTDEDREIAALASGAPLQPITDAIEFATDRVMLKLEVRLAALIKATSWSGVAAGGEDAEGLWAAGGSNTFLADVKARIATIQGNTGIKPNRLLLDFGTYMSLTEESTVLDKIKYTQRGVLTAELLAAILDLEKVLVGAAVKSTAKESKAGTDFTASKIWEVNAGKGMGFLYYAPPVPGLKVPSALYVCRGGNLNGFQGGVRVTTWREDAEHQDVYEAAHKLDIVACDGYLGFMWKDTLLT